MKYYLIAGEASGDIYGAQLIEEIQALDPNSKIRFWGGDLMKSKSNNLVKHYKDTSVMGFFEVLKHIFKILRNIDYCKNDILEFKPDRIIYIDYPGFNLRICKWAKKKGFINHYYISPQIWAWKENRINAIKRDVDQMHVILPFEKTYYVNKHGLDVHYSGHPLVNYINNFRSDDYFFHKNNIDRNKPIIALLPGSRIQEIKKVLPVFLSIVKDFNSYQFIIGGVDSINKERYDNLIKNSNVKVIFNETYNLLANANAAIVTSGTASLEAAILKVPQVVCYKTSLITYLISKMLVNIKYISLVNLILNNKVVDELVQGDLNSNSLKNSIYKILNKDSKSKLINSYHDLINMLSKENPSKRTAEIIIN
ncbi:MAG: lipid-A-disaccharide synthase [Bacteroidota bacterium]|nr:lipid-A-disaccharide synthase [Bacteroidota bacterium]